MLFKELREKVEGMRTASAWKKGLKQYATECLDFAEYCGIQPDTPAENLTIGDLMNHVGGNHIKIGMFHSQPARDIIRESSEGGNFLIYDEDIAERLCAPSHFKALHRKDGSLKNPRRESWLEVQTRAIIHAVWEIQAIAKGAR